MKTKDIAKKYGIKQIEFEKFLKNSGAKYKVGLTGWTLDDNIEVYVDQYKESLRQEEIKKEQDAIREQEEKERQRLYEEEKQKALASMLITSGFTFEGYKIKKYSGYISGDDAIQVDRGTAGFFSSATNVGDSLMGALAEIRRNSINELKEAAYALGCNAVIGVDFDYLTLEPETANSSGGTTYLPYVFGVTANGNAVIIEKEDE